ncbi:DUF397 domain-containing protein [Streptomyces sp. NPDC047108]|uniref:DUF397 domain-containing protein n=1 Tax=Streptomyces sp. NPDC047108 TaxID=3155025 RepID=UPI0033E13AE9
MPQFVFVKSRRSADGLDCVEVATNVPGTVAVRDSKDPEGPILRFAPAEWVAFRAALVRGCFDAA